MSTFSTRHAHVSFHTHDGTHIASSSSHPSSDALVAPSSSPGRLEMVPLGATKTIPALNKRGVIFSPRTDTKFFHSDDLILPSPNTHLTPKAPSSIRSYSDPITPYDSPSLSKRKGRTLSDTPTLVRSILKARAAQQIRLAASVEEGTLNNKEAARLLVSGKRPKLFARDSFQLALMRNAAGEQPTDRKGKGKMLQDNENPGSDDSTASNSSNLHDGKEVTEGDAIMDDNSSEEEEETIEEDGALSTGSLVNIILDGAEDLLTLEEAYNTLTLRLRSRIPTETDMSEPLSPAQIEGIRISAQPIKDEAPAMVRAIQRDLQRLLGKLPSHESELTSSELEITPFKHLMPLRDDMTNRGRFTPSPTPGIGPKSSSPTKSTRQGYTEAEVRYRREASGVGAAVLRFLSFTFHSPHLFACYSDADLTSLLEQVMTIPRTLKLPTPNPKRTYYLSILVLAQMNLPSACVQPVKDKIVRALEGAMADNLGAMGGLSSGKEGPSAIKKEGYHAVTNLVSNYPSTFFPHYPDLLAGCLRGMASSTNMIRYKAGAATAAFARAKFSLLANTQSALLENPDNSTKEAWSKAKSTIQKSEFFVLSHLKSALKIPGKSSPIYGKDGEKKTEWHPLEQIFKDTVGSATDVHWACAAWSLIVTLMGSAYASSGLAAGFDHIMDRSLQPSTNVVRPLLARVAWNHAIHAYLSSGFASSISEDKHLIRSYKPFAASSQQTIEQRTSNIQFVVNLALSKATDKASYARALTNAKPGIESHYIWQRSEKNKKLQWLITCGLGATAVVYAHTGMAICHEDQPAKEMSAISGLPSSDGIPLPDLSPEEARLPRLDHAWEKVVNPMLKSFFTICGVDRLTIHGWKMFAAITSPNTDLESKWDLDRLLIPRYMSGEIFFKEKETDFTDLLADIQEDELQPSDIPSWGHFWAAKRLGRLLNIFDEALTSIHGLNDSSTVSWIMNDTGLPLIPEPISNIWKNLLLALRSAKIAHAPPTPLFFAGLQAVTLQLIQTFNRDPKTYVPINKIDDKGRCLLDEDEMRIGLTSHLFDAALQILGEDILGALRLRLDQIPSSEQHTGIYQSAFGGDANNHPTVAGILLSQFLRSKSPSTPINPSLQHGFKGLVQKILDVGSVPGYAGKLLGDITNAMPFLFEDCEEVQLDIWRLLAIKWTQVIDLQPSSTTSSTNHTGALLVSLLSGPFRGRQITSYWHRHADKSDLEIWQALLKVTVLRFRAKRFGSNCGVLEALAGHLGDFLSEGEKTSSTTITLSCLASAISWMSFTPPEGSQSSPWHISDENFIPVDFLTLVNDALIEAYPVPETQNSTMTEMEVSPAVFDLLQSLAGILEDTPRQFVGKILDPVKAGLATWLEDKERVLSSDMHEKLDEVYVIVLNILSSTMPSEDLPINSETLNSLAEIYIPRISKAQSSSVPLTFQSFWNKTFATVNDLMYSEDVADFLRDLLMAVPGMIVCPGLEGSSVLSQDESLSKYPHIQATQPEQEPERTENHQTGIEVAVEAEAELTNPEYDADVSQSLEQTQVHGGADAEVDILVDETRDDMNPLSSPTKGAAEDHEDVFGPAALTRTAKAKGKKKVILRQSRVKSRRISEGIDQGIEMQSLPELETVKVEDIPTNSTSLPEIANDTPLVEDSDEDCIIVMPSPRFYKRKGLSIPVSDSSTPTAAEAGNDKERQEDDREEKVEDTPATNAMVVAELEAVEDTPSQENVIDVIEDTPLPDNEIETEEKLGHQIQPELVTYAGVEQRLVDSEANLLIQPTPAPGQTSSGSPSRPSLLISAGRWLSKVHSLPFFSPSPIPPPPTQPEIEPQTNTISQVEREEVVSPLKVSQASKKLKKGKRLSKRDVPRSASVISQFQSQTHSQGEEFSASLPDPEPISTKATAPLTKSQSTGSIPSTTSSRNKRRISDISSIEIAEPRRSKRRKPKSPSPSIPAIEENETEAECTSEPAQVDLQEEVIDISITAPEPIDDDEDDELLLSPESARRRKREEEEEVVRFSQIRSTNHIHTQVDSQFSQSISGRFDDAPEDSTIPLSLPKRPRLTKTPSSPSPSSKSKAKSRSRSKSRSESESKGNSIPPSTPTCSASNKSSPSGSGSGSRSGFGSGSMSKGEQIDKLPNKSPNKRTTQQAMILEMLDEAARSKQAIDNLDYQGVKSLLKNLNVLREAAEERMISRMEELRNNRM
ncbi:uncharacterized protein IL334_004888 [Kwoniella shivajii]|uniref:Telomere-associated protein Rif1 N-terminal domain-containing protein n=1 Tax=Kwoniella shivajii TaxID=564305 RepID=A0ABZ1D1M1_9TREE|nr:hypothetical protein IL334_004888 [Kwoniella shivajii]